MSRFLGDAWQDRRVRCLVPLLAGVAAVAVGCGSAEPTAPNAGASPPDAVSNSGTQIELTEDDHRTLALVREMTDVPLAEDPPTFVLGEVGGTRFYRVVDVRGSSCFSATSAATERVGDLTCTRSFPSTTPILDLSIYGADARDEPIHLISLRGIAADRVATVRLVDSVGEVTQEVRVKRNLFAATDVGPGVVGLEAVDDAGRVIFRR